MRVRGQKGKPPAGNLPRRLLTISPKHRPVEGMTSETTPGGGGAIRGDGADAAAPGATGLSFIPFSDIDRAVVWRRFWRVVGAFWTGASRRKAWFFTIGIAIGLTLVLLTNLSVNRWQSALFNALEKKDADRALMVLWLLPLIVALGATAGAIVVWTRETLQAYWREWVVGVIADRWLASKRYRRLQEAGIEPANPEYRIADDVRVSLDPLVDFAIGWFSALLAFVTFIGVLWTVGGSWTIHGKNGDFTIPAFMVLAAILYGVTVSTITWFVGKPLVNAVARRNEAEALLRFELTKVREHAARVAAQDGGPPARRSVAEVYRLVLERSLIMVRYHVRLTWITNGNGVLLPVAAVALATPKYLAGEMSLGDLVSLGPAFQQVQVAMAWLVDNFRQLALWYASAGRVVDMAHAMDALDGEELSADPAAATPGHAEFLPESARAG
jgi:putative ATP-binding cassette transporter